MDLLLKTYDTMECIGTDTVLQSNVFFGIFGLRFDRKRLQKGLSGERHLYFI